MRLTIVKKIGLALSVVVTIGLLAMLLIYQGLGRVGEAMHDLAETKEPASAAGYEMEIQLHAIGLAVLRYLDTDDPVVRSEVSVGDAQFTKFQEQYSRLATTPEEQALAQRIKDEYQRFREEGEQLLAAKDARERKYASIAENFEQMDEVLERRLYPSLPATTPLSILAGQARLREQMLHVEADVAEVGLWLANYHRVPRQQYRDLMLQKKQAVEAGLREVKAADLSGPQRHWVGVLSRLFGDTSRLIQEVQAQDEALRQRVGSYVKTRDRIDHLLDKEIQARASEALKSPRRTADAVTTKVLDQIPFLMLAFLSCVVMVTVLLARAVTRPVRALADGAARVGQGDLAHRISPISRDELADLTDEFNRMVERLQATTVSKGQLEESERKLHDVVARLRREISERNRAEEDRAKLEVSLRRAETMSVMGAVVAGVAHEVRNPLFGISSSLDAMEARYGASETSHPYVRVLREQVDRLTRLMQELLEYGKPYNRELSVGPVGEAIEEAMRLCDSVSQANVAHVAYVEGGALPLVLMDRPRLARAFANLVENAIQHSPPDGLVSVRADLVSTETRAWVEVAVTDQGTGVPPEELPRIFDPFFTRRRGGTGLGLSIVQRIVEEHDGVIWAANRPEGGAALTVRLPTAPAETHLDGRSR